MPQVPRAKPSTLPRILKGLPDFGSLPMPAVAMNVGGSSVIHAAYVTETVLTEARTNTSRFYKTQSGTLFI